MPLKYLCNFWISLKMSLINCKAELNLKQKSIFLSVAGNESTSDNDDNDNAINITFTIKDTTLYVPVVTLSARELKIIKTPEQRI